MAKDTKFRLPRAMLTELDTLVEKLTKAPAEERKMIMTRLEFYEKSGKIPLQALLAMCEDDNASLANYAIMGLGRDGSPEAVKKLLVLLEKHNTLNRMFQETIIDALGQAGDKLASPALLELIGIRVGWKAKLLAFFRRKKAEADPVQQKRRAYLTLPVLRAVEKLGDPRTVETLAPFLEHPDPLLRLHAIQNLMKSGVKDFNDQLRALSASDDHELVREAAELALTKLSPLPQHLNN